MVTHDVHTEGYPEDLLDHPIPAIFLHVQGKEKEYFNGLSSSPYFLFNWIHDKTEQEYELPESPHIPRDKGKKTRM